MIDGYEIILPAPDFYSISINCDLSPTGKKTTYMRVLYNYQPSKYCYIDFDIFCIGAIKDILPPTKSLLHLTTIDQQRIIVDLVADQYLLDQKSYIARTFYRVGNETFNNIIKIPELITGDKIYLCVSSTEIAVAVDELPQNNDILASDIKNFKDALGESDVIYSYLW